MFSDPSGNIPLAPHEGWHTLASSHKIVSPETLNIISQSGQKRHLVHYHILAAHLLLPESTTPGTGGEIDLSDWDSETVGRLVEFLYFAKYQVPEPTPAEDDEDNSEKRRDLRGKLRWDGVNPMHTQERRSSSGASTPDTLQSLADHEEWQEVNSNVDFLLAHAKVYALAQYKDIKGLENMALEKFRAALGGSEGPKSGRAVRDIIDLYRYVNSHTDSLAHAGVPIRDLISMFLVQNPEKLMDMVGMVCDAKEGAGKWKGKAHQLEITSQGEIRGESIPVPSTGRNVQQLQVASEGKAHEGSVLIPPTDRKTRQLGATSKEETREESAPIPPKGSKYLWGRPTLSGSFIVGFVVMCAIISRIFEDVPRHGNSEDWLLEGAPLLGSGAPQRASIGGRPFKGICLYHELLGLRGHYIMVGPEPLKDICNKHTPDPQATGPPPTVGEIMKAMCESFEDNSWLGSSVYSVGGHSLKVYCHSEGYTSEPTRAKPPTRTKTRTGTGDSTRTKTLATENSNTAIPTAMQPSGSVSSFGRMMISSTVDFLTTPAISYASSNLGFVVALLSHFVKAVLHRH